MGPEAAGAMAAILGIAAALGGLFLILWRRAVVSLPVARRPRFAGHPAFRWGMPVAGALLLCAGISGLFRINPWLAAVQSAICLLSWFLLTHFDPYTAEARLIRGHYRELRCVHPPMGEMEVLFHVARRRYPSWSEDRLVELIAGKDLEGLVLLMLVQENRINPLSDWELYRSLKARVARGIGKT